MRMTVLARLNLLLLAALVVHTLDHGLNQPARELPASAGAIGALGFVVVAISSVLAIRRSPVAAAASVAAGTATVLGLLAVHLTPYWWGFVSDPLWTFGANGLSWILALLPLGLGLGVAVAGARSPAIHSVR
jgi:hypothetical protein